MKTFEAEIQVAVPQTIWMPVRITLKAESQEQAYDLLRSVNEAADLAVLRDHNEATFEEATNIGEILCEMTEDPIRHCINELDFKDVEFIDWDSLKESEE
jgi:hypothetical protein